MQIEYHPATAAGVLPNSKTAVYTSKRKNLFSHQPLRGTADSFPSENPGIRELHIKTEPERMPVHLRHVDSGIAYPPIAIETKPIRPAFRCQCLALSDGIGEGIGARCSSTERHAQGSDSQYEEEDEPTEGNHFLGNRVSFSGI